MQSSYHGLLVVDKPGGITSRDVVDRAQRWFPRGTRIGHAGTLDPLATGVLVLCLGAVTRLTEYLQQMTKVYRAGLRLGCRSDTDDSDGTITLVSVTEAPTCRQVQLAVTAFIGEIDQVPPAFSAARVTGRRAYQLARKGAKVALEPRKVRIHSIEILSYEFPRLDLLVTCGKGTYIRSLARDLGERLGCGALVDTLRRERVGPFSADTALSLHADQQTALASLNLPAAAVAELPRIEVDEEKVSRLRRGQAIALGIALPMSGEVAVFTPRGVFAAVGLADPALGTVRPVKVLPDFKD